MTRRPAFPPRARNAGVTLIELAITIALVGILAAILVQFVMPVRSYIDTTRRAALADTADTALRRIGRDVRLALPNSTRVTASGAVQYLEFMLVRTGGRYRFDAPGGPGTCGGAGDALGFGAPDICFTTIGSIPNIDQVTTSDYVVVYNLQPGTTGADVYQSGNKSQMVSAAGTGEARIEFASATFTNESPGNRFFIIEGPVSYVCDPVAGTLTRRWGYTISAAQPTSFSSGSSALMASGVSACSFTYDSSVIAQGAGLVTLHLQLRMLDSRGDAEHVNLYHAVHVNNVP